MSGLRAIGLFSGGLDSILAYKLIEEQGISPIAVFFKSPFFAKPVDVEHIAERYGIVLEQVDITEVYLKEVLRRPEFGYGRFFNPCIDCHGFMVKQAMLLLGRFDARFVFTGEVLGERPFSQTNFGLSNVGKLGNASGLLLRPLSAKLLPISVPEERGWVDRGRLLAIKGRSRKQQFTLAKRYGIDVEGLLQPSGGCLLTDPAISERVRAYINHFKDDANWVWGLVKTGRHFAPAEESAFVIGRNEEENNVISRYASRGVLFSFEDIPGPVGLLSGTHGRDADVIVLCANILFAYAKQGYNEARIRIAFPDGKEDFLTVKSRQDRDVFRRFILGRKK